MLKNLPAVQETSISIPGSGRSPEKEMATHSSIFAWRIPWTEEPGGLQSMGLWRVRNDWVKSSYSKKICKVFYHIFSHGLFRVKTWHACEEARCIPGGQSSGLHPPKAHLGKQKWYFLRPAPSRDVSLHQHLEPLFVPLCFWKWKGNFLKRSPTLAL